MQEPKITFGIIVLNGEPFTRYNLRSLYPFAHEIIVVEGAAPAASSIATPSGHSSDGTLETLRQFKQEEDPENKLVIITAEDEGYPNGFWPGEKDQQSQSYAKRATGDYLWQVDIDEFYKPGDIRSIIQMLKNDPNITAVSFPMITFWGGLDFIVDGWYLRRGAFVYHRLFKWGIGYNYVTHRPPTVYDPKGRDLRTIKWVDAKQLTKKGIYLYHYSLLFPKQVIEKCTYYQQVEWARREKALQWVRENFLSLRNPYRVHNVYNYPSWLNRFNGIHPPQVLKMINDIEKGIVDVNLRSVEDINNLLSSPTYWIGKYCLKLVDYADRFKGRVKNRLDSVCKRLFLKRSVL